MKALVLAVLLVLPQHALAQGNRPGLSMSGDARMGLGWTSRDDTFGPAEKGFRMTARARLHFQFMGETDGGTRFGVNFTAEPRTGRVSGQSVFIGR